MATVSLGYTPSRLTFFQKIIEKREPVVLRNGTLFLNLVLILTKVETEESMSNFKKFLIGVPLITLISFGAMAASPLQQAERGTVERHVVYSPQLADSIAVDVWLPDAYDIAGADRFPVVYMHDGQNLYDRNTTWNGQSWEMDTIAARLIDEGEIPPVLIVGIHSDPAKRVSQLMPQQAVTDAGLDELMAEVKLKGKPVLGNQYADFVTETLKPYIDSSYRTLPDREHTTVMGSSMGGLMSLYLICRAPEVFGGAGCLSTHWYGSLDAGNAFGDALMSYMQNNLPDPATHRLYFDHGTETIDAYYGPWEEKALTIARAKGYRDGQNLDSYIDNGASHNEDAWAARVDRPLRFLLKR